MATQHGTPFGTGVQRFSEPRGALPAARPAAARWPTLGLIAFSIFIARHARPRTTSPGARNYFVYRQAVYAVVGLVLMLAASPASTTRACASWKLGLYALHDRARSCWCYAVGVATRGSRRWIELPFFRFQPSELGKVLLVARAVGAS